MGPFVYLQYENKNNEFINNNDVYYITIIFIYDL